MNIGSAAGVLPATGGITDDVLGSIEITATRKDTLNLDDTATLSAKVWTLGANTLTDGTFTLTHRGLGAQKLFLGSGSDSIIIGGTSSSVTEVYGNAGDDIFDLQATGATTFIRLEGGSGVNTLNAGVSITRLSGIKGGVAYFGSGADAFNADDSGRRAINTGALSAGDGTQSEPINLSGFGMNILGITATGIAGVNIKLGGGADTLTINNTPSVPVSIDTGAGNDIVKIHATRGALNIALGEGNDIVKFGSSLALTGNTPSFVLGPVTLDGGTNLKDRDILDVNASGLPGSIGELTITTLTGIGFIQPVNYSAFESVKILLGLGDDTFTLGPGTGDYTTLRPGPGINTIIRL